MIRTTLGLTAVLAFGAASAGAQTTMPAYPAVAKGPLLSLAPSASASRPVAWAGPRYAQAPITLPRGVAKTSVERREGGVTGSAGVLCGIQPSADDSGVGAARGYDNEGRFVGAKLAFSF